MRYGYKAKYSESVLKILKSPEKSRALADAIVQIRRDPTRRTVELNGNIISTDPHPVARRQGG